MDRFSALFSRLSRDGEAPMVTSTFDQVDRYFFTLRVASAAAAIVWLWRFAAPGATLGGLVLTGAFTTYSLLLYLEVWRRPQTRARAYLAVGPADLVFLFFLCHWSAEPMSGIYLAFYLLLALHAFYFGSRVAVAAAASFACLYTILYFTVAPAQRCSLEELVLRVGFGFFIAGSLALVSRAWRLNRHHLSEANRQLEHRNRILEQTYRQLSIGRLAGEVAHHINNPAAIIVGKAETMRRRAESDGLAPLYLQDLSTIAEAAYRIGGVVRSLLALSPHHDGAAHSIDVGGVAQGVALLFETQAAERRIRLHAHLASGLRVHAQESAVRQVILNLLCNAFDAVAPGGEVSIETHPGAEPDRVELRVHDDGHGIAREHIEDVFSPFFSTKIGAGGVGLGLSQSLSIVRRLGGTLRVESEPGHGSTFIVDLPADAVVPTQQEVAA